MWIIFAIVFSLFFSLAYAAGSGAPWVPTWRRDIDRLRGLLDLQPGEHFVELGCGDGRVTRTLARATGAHCTGVELSLAHWLIARSTVFFRPIKNCRFVFGNIFTYDLRQADAVYLYLMPETYAKIQAKLALELPEGTRVVSYVWPIPGWQPLTVDTAIGRPNLFLYKKQRPDSTLGEKGA